MSYRTILVHLDMGRKSHERIDLALRLAASQEAHLVALYSTYVSEPPTFYMTIETAERLDQVRAQRVATGNKLQEYLNEAARRADVKVEWRATEDYPNVAVPLHARHADLVIVGQTEPNDAWSYIAPGFLANLLMSAGRPVLVVPYVQTPANLGQRPLVAWDCSRAATRAIHDALPFLRRAQHCDLLTVNTVGDDQDTQKRLPGAEIATVLARHSIEIETHNVNGVEHHLIGESLLSRAADLGSDLIVAGAYGHARIAELILGGVTRTLLDSMTVPVLFSH